MELNFFHIFIFLSFEYMVLYLLSCVKPLFFLLLASCQNYCLIIIYHNMNYLHLKNAQIDKTFQKAPLINTVHLRTSSSQEENNGRLENHFGDDNTNDSSTHGCVDGWPTGMPTSQEEDDDEDDRRSVASTASNISGLSDFSNFSGKDWKPCAGR